MDTQAIRYPEAREHPQEPPSRFRRWLLRTALTAGVIAVGVLLVGDRGAMPARAAAGPFVVNTNNDVDDGLCDFVHCSLREAINAANLSPGNQIWFNIPGGGVHVISVGSSCGGCQLPDVTAPTAIRGDTQPGYAGSPLIEVRYCCTAGSPIHSGLRLMSHTGSTVFGLAFTLWDRAGIYIFGGGGHIIGGNHVGINAEGTLDFGNTWAGIEIESSNNNAIGDLAGGLYSNVISGNDGDGIRIWGTSSGNLVIRNAIGTYPDGTTGFVSNNTGISITDTAHDNQIGVSGSALANTIAGNGNWAIDTDSSGAGNQFSENHIFDNGAGNPGIDTTGAAAAPAAPVVTSATFGALAVTPGAQGTSSCIGCLVEVFSSDDCEGRRFEGRTTVTGGGTWQLRATLSGPKITATVTDSLHSTSRFSNCIDLSGRPTLRPGGSLGVSLIDPPWDGFSPHISGRAPGVASDAMFDLRYPGFDPGPRDIVIHVTGSTLMPGGAPAFGSQVARLWVDFDYCGLGHYTLSANPGNGGLAGGIPLNFENETSAYPYLPAGWNTLDVAAAIHGDAEVAGLYDDAGNLVSNWGMSGEAWGFVMDSALGGHDLLLGEIGSDTRLGCARITRIRVLLRGKASDGTVFRQNGAAGFYRAFATYSCGASPYGSPCPGPAGSAGPGEMLVQGCDYVDTNPPPASFDVDGDCLASPTDTNDANPDQDGDGVYDGIEVAAGTNMALPDSDGDGVGDAQEIADRTTSAATNDFDGDTKKDNVDNCPRVSNSSQADLDGDGVGDACDDDMDGDGLTNAQEATMHIATITSPANEKALRCVFGAPTLALIPTDPDTDNDGWRDGAECTLGSDPLSAASTPERCNGADDDGDGLTDEAPLDTGLFLTYDTNPAGCAPKDPDGDGAIGITENKIRTINRVDGEWEDLPAGALLCTDPNVDCNPDGDANNSNNDADSDNDGIPDLVEYGQYGSSPASAASDNDGCPDGYEPFLSPPTDPTNGWDFYSVPVPALYAAVNPLIVFRDKAVTASDAQAVFAYFKVNAKAGTPVYEQDLNANGIKDGVEYDRTVLGPGVSGPPDGAMSAQEAQTAFKQFTFLYNCN